MLAVDEIVNRIFCGHSLEILRQFPAESVHMSMTSPPYWGKRSYKTQPLVWDGDPECKHDFTLETEAGDIRYRPGYNTDVGFCYNPDVWEGDGKGYICSKCGAWRGELGHEPTPELYVKHLCDIFDEVKRVLKREGTCFVNIGDSYYGSGGSIGHTPETKNFGRKTSEYGAFPTGTIAQKEHGFLQPKSQCCIPEMFKIEMVKRGWIARNTLIWHKPNAMPESTEDRFTVDFEHVFFFVKNNSTLYWTNEKTLKLVTKQPKTSVEGIDWEWRPCKRCGGAGFRIEGANTGINNKDPYMENNPHLVRLQESRYSGTRTLDLFFEDNAEEPDTGEKKPVCKKCSGTGRVRANLWTGHDYYFEQQFEPYKMNRWGGRYKYNEDVKFNPGDGRAGGAATLNRKGYDCYPNPFGRNLRSVWTIKTMSFKGAHFAVYPEELITRPIQAGCPDQVCKNCGMLRVKIMKPTGNLISMGGWGSKTADHLGVSPTSSLLTKQVQEKAVVGYSGCGCNAEYESGIVLDPFMGSGTTALTALKLGKRFVGIDSNPEYVKMAIARIKPHLEQKKITDVQGD